MNRRKRPPFFVTLLLLLLVSVPTVAGPSSAVDAESAFAGFDEWVDAIMKEWKVPGLAVAVLHDGEIVLAKGYGYRDYESQLPVTPDTLFAIGSNSKSFTATLLGLLNDDGRLDWDQPIREVMPDFRLHDPVAGEQMTARDLVTHRSGLPRHDLLWLASGLSREELYRRLRYLEPSQPFRNTFQYQNLMFMTAGYLAERITGKTWEQLVDERILEPLGMERSNFSVDRMAEDDDFSYAYSEKDDEIERIPFRNIDEIGPAGSINSSVSEMMSYVQFHLDYGKVDDTQLLSEANARQMQTPQMVLAGPIAQMVRDGDEIGDPSYGLGLMVGSYRGRKHVRHGGGIDGFISAMEWLPNERIGVVVLTNTSANGTTPTLVARNVFDRLLGLEPIDWAGRAREQQQKGEESAAEAKQAARADQKQGTSPSHALEDYVGSYLHPGYGVAEVGLDGERLAVSAVGFEMPLEHYHFDVFVIPDDLPPPLDDFAGTKVLFRYGKSGDIDELLVPLEASVPDIVFERLGDEAMKEISFLEKLVGEYELSGVVATVALKGESLSLTVPGQPVLTLVPDRGTTFKLGGLEGYRVEFELASDSEHATAVTFFQPNGTFAAKRR